MQSGGGGGGGHFLQLNTHKNLKKKGVLYKFKFGEVKEPQL